MNVSPLQRRFIIKQRIYSISVVLSRLILFLGFIGIWEFTADKGIINAFIFSSPVRLPDIYRSFQRWCDIHAYIDRKSTRLNSSHPSSSRMPSSA